MKVCHFLWFSENDIRWITIGLSKVIRFLIHTVNMWIELVRIRLCRKCFIDYNICFLHLCCNWKNHLIIIALIHDECDMLCNSLIVVAKTLLVPLNISNNVWNRVDWSNIVNDFVVAVQNTSYKLDASYHILTRPFNKSISVVLGAKPSKTGMIWKIIYIQLVQETYLWCSI